jgi:ABC-type sulfate transport system permease component
MTRKHNSTSVGICVVFFTIWLSLLRVAALDGELGAANEWRISDETHVLSTMFLSGLASLRSSSLVSIW